MVFVDRFPFFDAAEYLIWNIELRKADERLEEDQDIGDKSHDAVEVGKSSFWVSCFIHLDDYQARNQSHDSNKIQCEVDMRPCHFLLRGVGGL
jgi:hypothetical protein